MSSKFVNIGKDIGVGILAQLSGFLGDSVGRILSVFQNILSDGFKAVTEYNQHGINVARQLGMNFKEAQGYTETLIDRAIVLGKKYGISAKQVFELQENLSAASGKALMLNNQEAERMVQINKMVGTSVANDFISEIMTHMGGQLSTVQGAVSKAYATGAKSGLNAVKFSEKVASNLSMANRLSFKNGVDGIIKMTALSEKLGFNLQSVERAASNFLDIDKAIENAAHLQMLGGAASAYGGNPLEMAYEANYDPEAFTERMTDMLKGLGTFDAKTGISKVNGLNMDIARGIASALGIGADEAVGIAKKQAELNYKEGAFGARFNTSRYTNEQKDMIMNRSYVENGRLMINDINGNKHDITEGKLDERILSELSKFNDMEDSDLLKSQAQSLTSINEKAEGIRTSLDATIAKPLIHKSNIIYGAIDQIGNFLCNVIGPKLAEALTRGLNWIEEHKKGIKVITNVLFNVIGGTLDAILNNFGLILAAIIGWKTYKLGGRIRRVSNMFKRGGAAKAKNASWISKFWTRGSKFISSFWNGGTKFMSSFWSKSKDLLTSIKNAKIWGKVGGVAKSAWNSVKGFATKESTINATKAVGKVGASAGAVLSVGLSGMDLNDTRKEINKLKQSFREGSVNQEEYNKMLKELTNSKNEAIGAGVGAAIGAVITSESGGWGAIIGDIVGKYIGRFWNGFSNSVSDFWNGTVRDLATKAWGDFGAFAVDSMGAAVDNVTTYLGTTLEYVVSGFGDIFGGVWENIKSIYNGWATGLTKIINGDLTGIVDIYKGAVNGMLKQTEGLLNGIFKIAASPIQAALAAGESALDNFESIWETNVNKIKKGLLMSVDENTKNILKENYDKLHKVVFGTIDSIKESFGKISNALESFTSFPGKLIEMFREFISWLYDSAKNYAKEAIKEKLPNGAWEKASSAKGAVESYMRTFNEEGVLTTIGRLGGEILTKVVGKNADGGIVGGNSYSGDKLLTRVNSGEMILNPAQQSSLFSFISNVLTNSNDVKTKPIGEKEYIYTPNKSSVNGVTELTVRDINVNVNGTIRLDGGGVMKDIDINRLLSDHTFVNSLKDLITDSINTSINSGRFMNDNSTLRGGLNTTIWGR